MNDNKRQVDDFFCFRLRKHARKVTRFFDNKLKKIGLKSTQLSLLIALSDGGKSLTLTSEKLGMERTTLTRGLIPLERDGLIKRVYSEDNRAKLYVLTESGKEYAAKGSVMLEEAQNMIFSGIDDYKRLMEM